jgi:LAO/AO transport system kinase
MTPEPPPVRPADDLGSVVAGARQLEKGAIATLIRRFEDTRPTAASGRAAVMDLLGPPGSGATGRERSAPVIGVTGTPGSGKSSLIARLVPSLLDADPELTVAVVAVDPSSHTSGGALLGDRTRMRPTTGERRTYFRSQASATELGGLAPSTYQVCRLLGHLFDAVVVETVGIGQSELDIRHLADQVYLVLQPLGGDEIQYLKAGIVEIPDSFILNKDDEPAAERCFHQLRSSLSLARPFVGGEPPIHRTSARTGQGIADLVAAVLAQIRRGPTVGAAERDVHFLGRWVRDEWGQVGVRSVAAGVGDLGALYRRCGDLDRAQQRLDEAISASVCRHRS